MVRDVEPTYDILICSIAHRTEMLAGLLAELEHQIVPGVGVRVLRDNLQIRVGEKRQRLLDSSEADYVSFIDDDDLVTRDFVTTIRDALRDRPDYVGFRVCCTLDGFPTPRAYHSLQHKGWEDTSTALYRDLVHLNPIRRDLALKAQWGGGYAEDRRWATQLRDLDCVRTEVWIDRDLYWYRSRSSDTFTTTRTPMIDPPPNPPFDFVTWLNA